jgi:hypothetical protein
MMPLATETWFVSARVVRPKAWNKKIKKKEAVSKSGQPLFLE